SLCRIQFILFFLHLFLMFTHHLTSTLFPYTTLFRSQGMAHALRHVASLRLMCDPRDLGAVAEVRSVTTRLPTVTVYEIYPGGSLDRKSTRLNSSHVAISYAVFCLKKKKCSTYNSTMS